MVGSGRCLSRRLKNFSCRVKVGLSGGFGRDLSFFFDRTCGFFGVIGDFVIGRLIMVGLPVGLLVGLLIGILLAREGMAREAFLGTESEGFLANKDSEVSNSRFRLAIMRRVMPRTLRPKETNSST